MTDTKKLKNRINDSGYKMNFLASKLGITPYSFAKKVNNKSEFKVREIALLCECLHIGLEEKELIFFAAV